MWSIQRISAAAAVVAVSFMSAVPIASGQEPDSDDPINGHETEVDDDAETEVVVALRHPLPAGPAGVFDTYGIESWTQLPGMDSVYKVSVESDDAAEVQTAMESDPSIAYFEQNQLLEVPETIEAFPFWAFPFWAFPFWAFDTSGRDGVTDYVDQPAVTALLLADAHTVATGATATVAVLDTGVDTGHPLLGDRLVPGFDAVDLDFDPSERADGIDDDGDGLIDEAYGHGTNAASLALLVAPDANIMPVRVLNADGIGDEFAIAQGILWATNNGADIISLSLGATTPSALLDQVIADAAARGVTVVAAAGNQGSTQPVWPAAGADTIAVGAVDATSNLSAFSSRGEWLDIVLPGEDLVSAHPDGRLIRWDGTSAATPLAAGFAALAIETAPIHQSSVGDVFDSISQDLVADPSLGEDQTGDGLLLGSLFVDLIAAAHASDDNASDDDES